VFPYFPQPQIRIGPVTVHAFGVLVVCGVLAGRAMILRRAARQGLSARTADRLCLWMLVCGFIGAHLYKALYEPRAILRDWTGIASFGGVLGGLLGGAWWMQRQRMPRAERFQLLDIFAFCFPFAWAFGRLGCTLAHDHPGVLTTSWLAVRFPRGARYDLGLIELMFTLPLAAVFLVLDRKPRPPGLFFGLLWILYGGFRLWLDTLHEAPTRYFGVTLDQIGGILGILVGLWVAGRQIKPGYPALRPR
jgi:phosphatidylglycerol:prolipoprotein diacylglycerol transferase